MQGIGFTDEIDADELAALDHALTAELAAIEPPAAEFRYLTIHPEAVYLKAHPAASTETGHAVNTPSNRIPVTTFSTFQGHALRARRAVPALADSVNESRCAAGVRKAA